MWIATKFGFFSIVQKDDGFHVRARKESDLVNLAEQLGAGEYTKAMKKAQRAEFEEGIKKRIVTTPLADYRFRIVFTPPEMKYIVGPALISSIDYSNFKNEVHANDQADKYQIYTGLWHSMFDYQQENR